MTNKVGRFPKPCIKCGSLTAGGSYCQVHEKEKQGRYSNPAYRKQRAVIKAMATHCHLCGQAFTNRNEISADHVIPGDIGSPLLPAHISCNSRRGDKSL